MRHITLFIIGWILWSALQAQDGTVSVNFDLENKHLDESALAIQWKHRKSIRLKINGLNSAYFATKLTDKPFVFDSDMHKITIPRH
jgi:hypothetical protein